MHQSFNFVETYLHLLQDLNLESDLSKFIFPLIVDVTKWSLTSFRGGHGDVVTENKPNRIRRIHPEPVITEW